MAALDLRPLSLGELLDHTFSLYRKHFFLFVGIAAIPYSFFFIINLAFSLLPIFAGAASSVRMQSSGFVAAAAGGMALAIVAIVAGAVAFLFSVGATVHAVSEIYMGRQTSIRASLRWVRGKAVTIFGVLFLSGLLMIAGFIALFFPGVYLMCRICVATPAALLEDLAPAASIRRSFDLTRDFAGRAFMIYMLYFTMVWGIVAVFQLPFIVLMTVSAKNTQLVVLWTVLMQVGHFIASALVAPVSTIGFALFYYDLRVRKEAFDLQMMMQSIGTEPATAQVTGGAAPLFGRDAS
jgi:uncharacterized membrane protein YciS (DUF1049 family)